MLPVLLQGRQIDLEDPLFVRLVNCVTPADHKAFVERFGDLGGKVGSKPKAVERHAAFLREGVEFALGGGRALTVDPVVRAWTANRLVEGVRVQPHIVAKGDGLGFALEAPNLAGFMALEVAVAIEAGAASKRCDHCHKLFLYGPLTGRRSHAKFCADRCRVAAMRVRNAEKGDSQ